MTTPPVRSLGSASGSGPPEPAPSPPQAARVTAAAVPAAPSRNILRMCMGFLLEIAVWGLRSRDNALWHSAAPTTRSASDAVRGRGLVARSAQSRGGPTPTLLLQSPRCGVNQPAG